jgi:hypothetical protein
MQLWIGRNVDGVDVDDKNVSACFAKLGRSDIRTFDFITNFVLIPSQRSPVLVNRESLVNGYNLDIKTLIPD